MKFHWGIPHTILISVIVNFSGPHNKTFVSDRIEYFGFIWNYYFIETEVEGIAEGEMFRTNPPSCCSNAGRRRSPLYLQDDRLALGQAVADGRRAGSVHRPGAWDSEPR